MSPVDVSCLRFSPQNAKLASFRDQDHVHMDRQHGQKSGVSRLGRNFVRKAMFHTIMYSGLARREMQGCPENCFVHVLELAWAITSGNGDGGLCLSGKLTLTHSYFRG